MGSIWRSLSKKRLVLRRLIRASRRFMSRIRTTRKWKRCRRNRNGWKRRERPSKTRIGGLDRRFKRKER